MPLKSAYIAIRSTIPIAILRAFNTALICSRRRTGVIVDRVYSHAAFRVRTADVAISRVSSGDGCEHRSPVALHTHDRNVVCISSIQSFDQWAQAKLPIVGEFPLLIVVVQQQRQAGGAV